MNAPKTSRSLEWLDLSGNNFATLPNLKKLSKLVSLKLQHCKQLKYLPELPSLFDLPFWKDKIGLYIFNCPELVDREGFTDMAFSWMMHNCQLNSGGYYFRAVESVTPGSEIPRWFDDQREGDHVRLDAYPIMRDDDCIGFAFCAIFVVPHQTLSAMTFSEPKRTFTIVGDIPVDFYGDVDLELVLDKSDHMLLFFLDREQFFRKWHHGGFLGTDLSHKGIEWKDAEVKKQGYRWVYKEDIQELLNSLARKRKFGAIEQNEGRNKGKRRIKDAATSSQENTVNLLQNEFENLSL